MLDIIALWVTMLLGIVKGCFELFLLAMHFWCVSGVLFLFAFLIEMICLAGVEGVFTGLLLPFVHTAI